MFNLNSKFYFIFLYFFLSLEYLPVISSEKNSSRVVSQNSSLFKNNFEDSKNYIKKNLLAFNRSYLGLEKTLKKDLSKLNFKIANLVLSDESQESESFINLEADIQYQLQNVLIAEGNVIVYFNNALLFSDKVTYDKEKKIFIAEGNVRFEKGDQYFECTDLTYNLIKEDGFINNIYGAINIESFYEDFNLENNYFEENRNYSNYDYDVKDLSYLSTANIGMTNDLNKGKGLKISDVLFEIPQIVKWRFKSKKIIINANGFSSEEVIFTNDAFNPPQFLLKSKNFSGELIKDKLKLISKNTWISLDKRFSFPIGRRTIFDKDPISKWGIGSDNEEKDGFYITRGFDEIKLSDDFALRLTPYFLIQRGIKGYTKSYRADGASIFSEKVKNDISTLDLFGLNTSLDGTINSWDINLNTALNSLDFARLDESTRSEITLSKSFDLLKKDKDTTQYPANNEKMIFKNFLDLRLSSVFREKVDKGFDGEAEIYFGNTFGLANRKSWFKNDVKSDFSLIYNIGKFNSEKRSKKELNTLLRNVFAANFYYEFPIWQKYSLNKKIDGNYKFSPIVVKEGINWISDINAALFFYSDGSKQEAFSLSTGPQIVLGSFKSKFLDYSQLNITGTFVGRNGESPFAFDDVNETERLRFGLKQQIYGPLVFNFESYLNLENGKFTENKYGLDINRRAYSLGAYYHPDDEKVGFNFKIYNFDYSGFSPKF